jgi:hypothetical protein
MTSSQLKVEQTPSGYRLNSLSSDSPHFAAAIGALGLEHRHLMRSVFEQLDAATVAGDWREVQYWAFTAISLQLLIDRTANRGDRLIENSPKRWKALATKQGLLWIDLRDSLLQSMEPSNFYTMLFALLKEAQFAIHPLDKSESARRVEDCIAQLHVAQMEDSSARRDTNESWVGKLIFQIKAAQESAETWRDHSTLKSIKQVKMRMATIQQLLRVTDAGLHHH